MRNTYVPEGWAQIRFFVHVGIGYTYRQIYVCIYKAVQSKTWNLMGRVMGALTPVLLPSIILPPPSYFCKKNSAHFKNVILFFTCLKFRNSEIA
jgi:hypothetical protein